MSGVIDRLVDLASCLCAQIAIDGLPGLCRCGLQPGAQVIGLPVGGDCGEECGQAWVRLASLYPSTSIGQPSTQQGNCLSALGLDVEMGVMRCVPIGDPNGDLPSEEDLAAATALQVADALSMRRAVSCCGDAEDWMLGQYAPQGPQGGFVGGIWTLSLLVF